MSKIRKFASLYLTNFWGVMNDNLLKTLVCFIAATWVDEAYKSIVVNATAGALVFPYLIFSPLAGKLPMYCNKVKVVRQAKIAEIPIMVLAIVGFFTQSVWLTLGAVLLMGLQSALFSPSKYGLIKDIGGVEGVSRGMGGMEAIAFLGILIGTVVASFMAETNNFLLISGALLALAFLGVVSSFTLKVKEEKTAIDTSANVFKFIKSTHRLLKKYRGMKAVIHFLSLFWWLSATIQIVLIIYCADTIGLTPSETGYILAITAIGITLGCVIGGILDKRFFMLGAVPFIGILMAILLAVVFAVQMPAIPFACFIFAVAFLGGIFKIPLDAEIQKRVDASELNIVLAFFNQVSFIYIFVASATNVLVTMFLPTKYVFLMLAVVFLIASLIFVFNYRTVLCFFGRTFIRLHYKVEHKNRELLETTENQNLLILPSHRAVIDPIMLYAELYNVRIQPLVDEGYFKIPVIGHVLGLFNAVEVPDLQKGRAGVGKVRMLDSIIGENLANGSNILFYPSGHITLDGQETIGNRHLAHSACQELPATTKVVAIRIKGLWRSQWSRYKKTHTPSLVKLLLKSLLLLLPCALHIIPRRNVLFEYTDITDRVREWSTLSKLEFNHKMEEFYNEGDFCEK